MARRIGKLDVAHALQYHDDRMTAANASHLYDSRRSEKSDVALTRRDRRLKPHQKRRLCTPSNDAVTGE